MGKFINPFTDMGFKRIFGQSVNKDLLLDFLNSLLEGERKVRDITFLDKERLPEYEEDRGLTYDVYCMDENGEEFIVEMQNRSHLNFKDRTVYYLSQAIARQGRRGNEWRYSLKAVYGVFFLNFRLPEAGKRALRTDIVLADRETHEQFSDKLRFIFIELPSFEKEEGDCENDFERWIYVLKNMETLQRMPFQARKSVFTKLEEVVALARLTKDEREKYDESIKTLRDRLSEIALAQQEGEEKGREEERAKNAAGMKAAGIPLELIASITGLSVDEVEAL